MNADKTETLMRRKTALTAALLALCAALTGCGRTGTADWEAAADALPAAETEMEEETMDGIHETAVQEQEDTPVSADMQEDPAVSAAEVPPADWTDSIRTAASLANGVQGRFTDAGRNKFLLENRQMSLLYDLTGEGTKGTEVFCSADGIPYFKNTGEAAVILPDGSELSAANSPKNGRMNSHRLGLYYYDFRFCDQLFVKGGVPEEGAEEDGYDIIKKSGGWSTHDTSAVVKKDGGLTYTVTSDYDPYIYTTVRFSAEKYDAVTMTIRTQSAAQGEIFIVSGSHSGYSAEQRTSFNVTAGEWTTVTVPLSVMPDYTGTVSGFRIDAGAEAGETVEVRELRAVKTGAASVPFALERVYHTYPDKVHEVLRVVATGDYADGGRFVTRTVIPADTVAGILLKNGAGESSDVNGFDFTDAEFVGFDIRDAGIWGVIMPDLADNGDLRVELSDGNYILTRGIDLPERVTAGEDVLFGHRIYASPEHDFDGLRREAEIERHPLRNAGIAKEGDGAKYAGYDPLAGCYRFTVRSSDFNRAYYQDPDKQYAVHARFSGDGEADRVVWVQAAIENNGSLEGAAVLDEAGVLLPIPVEVSKNFCGEYEEPLFDPADTGYGEAYFPLTVGADEEKRLTVLHLYQNWGLYPLKQLSSIAFHIPYYHLSVGVTETNCIAPYFVYGKDGWTLPDFRANSAPLWDSQPQHTSAGRLYFLTYTDAEGQRSKSESQSAEIVSPGPVYADIGMDYLSDDGRIRASYRHTETAQTDENRTYYHIRLDVLEDISFADFRRDFSFFTFDGRSVYYGQTGYLGEDGVPVTEKSRVGERVLVLGEQYPYYDYFGGDKADSVNFALIVRSADITVGGEPFGGRFVFYDRNSGSLNTGSLSLDLGAVTLKKGDRLELEIILLPWGYSDSTDDANVLAVRQDSCVDPVRLTVLEGEAVADSVIPSVRAADNRARFRLEGGGSTAAVRIYGFGSRTLPRITAEVDGEEIPLALSGKNGYDGYQVFYDGDGTYSFAFNVDMDRGVWEITAEGS